MSTCTPTRLLLSITGAQITQISVPSADVTAIQINVQGATKPSLFITVYNSSDDSALPALQQRLQQMIPTRYELIIMAGDFNNTIPEANVVRVGLLSPKKIPNFVRHALSHDKRQIHRTSLAHRFFASQLS